MTRTLADLSDKMKDIDFAMLSTHTAGGAIGARPMSNNGQVDQAGDAFFFALDATRLVQDIAADPKVGLSYHGKAGLLGMRPFFVAVEGGAVLIRDQARFAAQWSSDLDRWFDQGIATPGLVMIKVHAERVHYWDGDDVGEIVV